MEYDFKNDDEARFSHLTPAKRKAISEGLQQAYDAIGAVPPARKPGTVVRHVTENLLKPARMDTLARHLWNHALLSPAKGGGLAALNDFLREADARYLKLHNERKNVEAAQATTGRRITGDMARNSFLQHRSTLTYRDDLADIIAHSCEYLKTLTQEERQGVLEYVRTSQAKYLPRSTQQAYHSTINDAMVRDIWKRLLVETDTGIEVARDLLPIIRETSHFVSPHERSGR